ncbi:hypothetical protein [Sphingomonas sp. Leaf10]|uniref:hypothetical protein n=1 Tax=Sphingomonas sp. Leaf10 TaxID=1735676 RepID=UPI0006FCCABC|nr:hypothetical protein [Sphingomonas sp. Leaf10]KQM37946.1 hypothetical protein ASE59_11645 [Sphingomonas sp. Leaf10]
MSIDNAAIYRDSAGNLFDAPGVSGTGNSTAPSGTPAITQTFGLDSADDGLNATVVSTSPVVLLSADAYNARGGGVRLMLYDKATTPKATDDPKWTVYLVGLASGGREWPSGLRFDTGLAFMLIPDDASGLMAGDIIGLNLGYSS